MRARARVSQLFYVCARVLVCVPACVFQLFYVCVCVCVHVRACACVPAVLCVCGLNSVFPAGGEAGASPYAPSTRTSPVLKTASRSPLPASRFPSLPFSRLEFFVHLQCESSSGPCVVSIFLRAALCFPLSPVSFDETKCSVLKASTVAESRGWGGGGPLRVSGGAGGGSEGSAHCVCSRGPGAAAPGDGC